jgi:hypothetical protein
MNRISAKFFLEQRQAYGEWEWTVSVRMNESSPWVIWHGPKKPTPERVDDLKLCFCQAIDLYRTVQTLPQVDYDWSRLQ